MAYPRYIGKSAFASGTGALTVAALTGTLAGDIIILFAESANQTISTPTGYSPLATQVGVGTAGAAGAVRIATFYRILEDAADTATTVADSGDHTTAIKMLFRDTALYSGVLYTQATSTQTATTAMVFPGVTTFSDESMVILAVAQDTDAASTATVGAVTNANLTSITERHDQTVATNTGGGIAVITGLKATAGATGTSTATGSTSVTHAYHTIALARVEPQTSTTYFNNILTTSYFPVSDAMRITANSSGQVNASASGSFQPVTIAGNAFYDLIFKWYWRQYGTDTWTTSTAQASEAGASVSEGVLDNAGTFTDNETITGLTNGVQYEFVLFAARTSATPAIEVSFSASASISLPSTGYTITGESGSFTRTGGAANVLFGREVLGSPGSFSYSGNNANVLFGREVLASAVSYALSGNSANVVAGRKLVADSVSFSLTGQSAGALFGREVLADTQSYTFTGNTANVNYGRYVAAAGVSYSLAGSDISFAIGKALQLDSAAFSYTANAANLLATRTLATDTGTFSLSGSDVNVLFSKRLVAESWTYGLSGAAASLLHGKYISGGAGAFSSSYGPSTLLVSRRLQTGAGTYSLVISADVLKKSLLVSDSMSYTISGQSAGLVYKRIITTDSGTYTLTGQALSVLANKYLEASSGGYTSTYGPAALLVNRKLASEAANYAVTGLDVGLAYQSATALTLVAAPGSFTASYQSANVLKASKISADAGVFSFSGSSAGTLFKRILPLSVGTFSYLGQSVGTLYSRRLVSESAAYSISTPDLLLEYGRVLQLSAGIFNLSGTSVGVLAYRKLFSEQIDFSLVGSDLSFSITSALSKLFLGSISVSNLFLGDQTVLKAYLGSVQVWGGGGGAPIGFTLEVDTGAFVASYQEGAITRQMKAVGSPLAVSMSGSPVGVLIGRKVVAAAVSYTVNYNAASVVRTGAVSLGAYSVGLTNLGGGSVSFSLSSDGTTSPDTQGWFTTAPQTGVGTGKWVIFSQTGGVMSTSSPAIGSRIELTSTVTITGTYAGSAVRFANFSVQIYDAASGGNLIGSGTLYLEIDGS